MNSPLIESRTEDRPSFAAACAVAIACTCGKIARAFVLVVASASLACSEAATPHTEATAPRIELLGADAEVWAFRLQVEGIAVGAAQLASCAVEHEGAVHVARIERNRFHAVLELAPGVNEVRARCELRSGRRLQSQRVRYDVRLRDAPIAHAEVRSESGRTLLDASASRASERQPAPIVRYSWSHTGESLGEGQLLALDDVRVGRFRVRIVDALGREDIAEARLAPPNEHEWLDSAIGYGVLPPLYGGGRLSDVTEALDDLAELGVNALWLAPIFAAPAHDFGYAVVDYFRVRSDYGDAASLAELVRKAHARGLRVLLDLPANHTSDEHPYYRQTIELGERSHYYRFYDRSSTGRATFYFDWKHLPNLDYHHAEVTRFMREAARYWVHDLDVDGYRVDAAWGVRQRTPEYWPVLRADLARVEPELVLLAEASARDPYYLQSGFDLAYDWTDALGKHAWEHVFSAEPGVARRLNEAVLATGGDRSRILRFLNNNDTGKRFITKHGEPMTRVATAALLTLPGLPCLYSFDEVGAEFEPYAELKPIRAGNPELRAFHRQWIHLRRTREALWGDGFEVLHAGERDEAYAYLRRRGGQVVLVVLNFGARPATVRLALPGTAWPSRRARDVLNGQIVDRKNDAVSLNVPGWEARVYEPF